MNKRGLIAVGLVSVVVIALVAALAISKVSNTTDREYRIVIPDGTTAKIYAGEDPGIVPPEIHLTLGEKDILVIQNNDIGGHDVAGFWVGAGETLRQEFKSEAVYQGECTIHPSSQIKIVVSKP